MLLPQVFVVCDFYSPVFAMLSSMVVLIHSNPSEGYRSTKKNHFVLLSLSTSAWGIPKTYLPVKKVLESKAKELALLS